MINDDNNELYKVSIDFLIRDQECKYNIYIPLQEKKLLYRNNESDNYNSLVQLKSKGLDFVFLDKKCYDLYIEKRKLEQSLLNDKELNDKKEILNELQKDSNNLNLLLNEVGLESSQIKIINEMKDKTYKVIDKIKGLEEISLLMKQIKPNPMLKKNLEIYIGVSMLKLTKFDDKKYIDEFILAILICDSFLTEEEYWTSYSKSIKDIKIKNHAIDLVKKLPLNYLPAYIVAMIKNHHEKPDGSGYPNHITCAEMNLFTSIYIIAEEYVQEFMKRGMRTNELEDINTYINKTFSPYIGTNIEKALDLFNEFMRGQK